MQKEEWFKEMKNCYSLVENLFVNKLNVGKAIKKIPLI